MITAFAITCMAFITMREAGGEPEAGQIGVAYSVMNRIADPRYSSDACSVIQEPAQYSAMWDSIDDQITDNAAYWRSVKLSAAVYYKQVPDPTNNATHYHHACHYTWWAVGHMPVAILGSQLFYNDVP